MRSIPIRVANLDDHPILNVNLPGMDGLVTACRPHSRHNHTPILVLSAHEEAPGPALKKQDSNPIPTIPRCLCVTSRRRTPAPSASSKRMICL
jgi:hypothetical protein